MSRAAVRTKAPAVRKPVKAPPVAKHMPARTRQAPRKMTSVLPPLTVWQDPRAITELRGERLQFFASVFDVPVALCTTFYLHRKHCAVTRSGDEEDCTCIPCVITRGATA